MVMNFPTALLAAVILLAGIGASDATVRIAADPGGRIGAYVDRYQGCVAQARWSSSMAIVPRPAPSFSVRLLMTRFA
jgi:hypothetical protein